MELRSSWEANISYLVKKYPKIMERSSLILVHILSQINTVKVFPFYFFKTHFNALYLSLPRCSYVLVFPSKLLCWYIFSPRLSHVPSIYCPSFYRSDNFWFKNSSSEVTRYVLFTSLLLLPLLLLSSFAPVPNDAVSTAEVIFSVES
jgi:hypothetical protein